MHGYKYISFARDTWYYLDGRKIYCATPTQTWSFYFCGLFEEPPHLYALYDKQRGTEDLLQPRSSRD